MDILSFVLGYKKGKSQSGGGGGENKFNQLFNRTITEVTAEDLEGATRIETYAFYQCSALKSIIIPDSVTSIGAQVFEECTNLTDVIIGNGVTEIDSHTFSHCTNLINVTIGNSVRIISWQMFEYCSALKSIIIPDSVTTLWTGAFTNCTNLTDVTIGNGLTENAENPFSGCKNLKNFIITGPIPKRISFKNSLYLTIDSLKNIINALVDYSGTENEGKHTLTLNSTCNRTLEAEGATAPDGLTWSDYVLAKGWLLA